MNLKRVKADLDVAKNYASDLGNPKEDEFYYDIAAYHTQQAVEKTLKYVLHDIYGEDDTTRSFKTHNISTLILKVQRYGVKISDDLIDLSADITDWEANARYSSFNVATKNKILKAIALCESLLKDIELIKNTAKEKENGERDEEGER